MQNRVLDFLHRIQIREPARFMNMAVFALCAEESRVFPYILLREALQQGKVRINEVGTSGHVSELFVINESNERVFAMDGEELVGAKQNRILNTSIIIEANSKIKIPVSCVERGRWRNSGQRMYSKNICYPNLRGEKASYMFHNLKRNKMYASNQSAVWNSVEQKLSSLNVRSNTRNMDEIFEAKRKEMIAFCDSIRLENKVTGVAVAINGKVSCVDIFDKEETLERLWEKLISSYALDALERNIREREGPDIERRDIVSFLASPAAGEFSVFESPGIGRDVRFKASQCIGSALVCEDSIVHLEMFDNCERRSYPRSMRP